MINDLVSVTIELRRQGLSATARPTIGQTLPFNGQSWFRHRVCHRTPDDGVAECS